MHRDSESLQLFGAFEPELHVILGVRPTQTGLIAYPCGSSNSVNGSCSLWWEALIGFLQPQHLAPKTPTFQFGVSPHSAVDAFLSPVALSPQFHEAAEAMLIQWLVMMSLAFCPGFSSSRTNLPAKIVILGHSMFLLVLLHVLSVRMTRA